MIRIVFVCVIAFIFSACGSDQLDKDIEIIEQFIAENNLENVQSLDNGLHYIINVPGGTEKPTIDAKITVDYIGYYTDGQLFDSSYDAGEPLNINLVSTIRGWQQGIPLFGRGGRGMLIIPSELGYGSSPRPGIRDNAVLVFELEMLDFE